MEQLVPEVPTLVCTPDAESARAALLQSGLLCELCRYGVCKTEVHNGFQRLYADGWQPALTVSTHKAHPPHAERPDLSIYSVLYGPYKSHFRQDEWCSMDVVHSNAVGWELDYRDPEGWRGTFGETGYHLIWLPRGAQRAT